MTINDELNPKNRQFKRKYVIEKGLDSTTIYNEGEHGTIENIGEANPFPISDKDVFFLKEGANVIIKGFDPQDNMLEIFSYDVLKFDNPKSLPFVYLIEENNTYVFLKDGEKIISSARLENFTPSSVNDFAKAITGNETNYPQEVHYKGAERVEILNQLEELVTTGKLQEKKSAELSFDDRKKLMEYGHHLKIDEMKQQTTLDEEKAKILLANKIKHLLFFISL